MSGRLIAVVGPSGVGKDTVMDALIARRPGLHRVLRAITRAADSPGEPCESVSEAEFARRVVAGAFALHWPAHGLHYGVPTSVLERLQEGQDAVVNLSRSVLDEARRVFPGLIILSLSASDAVLRARLSARGRESKDDIEARIARARAYAPKGADVIDISNDGEIGETIDAILAVCYPARV